MENTMSELKEYLDRVNNEIASIWNKLADSKEGN